MCNLFWGTNAEDGFESVDYRPRTLKDQDGPFRSQPAASYLVSAVSTWVWVFCDAGTYKPSLGQLGPAVVAVLALEYTHLKHFRRRKMRLETIVKICAGYRHNLVGVSLLHAVVDLDDVTNSIHAANTEARWDRFAKFQNIT